MEGGLCIWEALSGRKATLCGARPGSPTLDFYPRPPRGGRLEHLRHSLARRLFLSTPSARRATPPGVRGFGCPLISIHALREEGDAGPLHWPGRWRISIHALREEGDVGRYEALCTAMDFYPRPPRGGRQFDPAVAETEWIFLSTPSARRATHTSLNTL